MGERKFGKKISKKAPKGMMKKKKRPRNTVLKQGCSIEIQCEPKPHMKLKYF